jgi:spore germination protein YaaH
VRSTIRRGAPARTLLGLALGALVLGACGPAPLPAPTGDVASPEVTGRTTASGEPTATVPPAPGHELYGFLPYWEMDDTIADHLAQTPLTTLALFSVTDTAKGVINTRLTGYRRITGDPGARIIREAHERAVRVELVFTSFGAARNQAFFANEIRQDATIGALVTLVGDLGLDGICLDVEGLDPLSLAEYGSFTRRLHDAVIAADPGDRVTVATSANAFGAAMAATAVAAGAERTFLMGYDYRVADSSPGATSPLVKRDGDRDLGWSIELYAAAGVPPERTLLGLPLYGMTWPVAGPVVGAPETGRGEAWILRRHLDILADAAIVPLRDAQEMVEVYLFGSDGSIGPPSPVPTGPPSPVPTGPPVSPPPASAVSPGGSSPHPPASPVDVSWTAVYVDSPATLAPKMELANANGFAGVGFWAIGYERGLPLYTALMERFVAGKPLE